MPDPTLGDWAAVGGAVFTACAAGAALLTARLGRDVIEASERPLVEAQPLRTPGGELQVALYNTGRGTARAGYFVIYGAGLVTEGVVLDGFMAPGQRVRVLPLGILARKAGALPDEELAVMVSWRDAESFAHYRTHTAVEWVPKTRIRRRPRYPDRIDAFERLYPSVSLEGAHPVSSRVQQD